jgi:hypothetical protein
MGDALDALIQFVFLAVGIDDCASVHHGGGHKDQQRQSNG